MSIIYEALKKMSRKDTDASTGIPSAQNGSQAVPEPRPGPTAASATASKKLWHTVKSAAKMKIALALVGTTVGIIITWLVMNKPVPDPGGSYPAARLNNPKLPATVNDPRTQNNQEKLAVQEAPELILNGIVLSADGNLALINEEILQAGDDIRGAKVQVITDKQVTLTFQNQEIILKKK